jgi:spermidine/putrescine transport system ATP-binding protein
MTSAEQSSLNVDNLVKFYEGNPLINDLSFFLREKEVLCLLGPSGSGKSTLLRIIAGLEPFESGRITWRGKDLARITPERRSFGFMFQDYALFPHLSVYENVAFGLRMQHLPERTIAHRVAAELDRVSMSSFADRRVQNLSGGEQQRIALARTLAPEPGLIMLDEPLGALDRKLREQLTVEIRRILKSAGVPAIYVTHDQAEAFTLADRILLLSGGRLAQVGTPEELYHSPNSSWVANFLGLGSVILAEVASIKPPILRTVLGNIRFNTLSNQISLGTRFKLLVRSDGVNHIKGNHKGIGATVRDCVFQGQYYRTEVIIGKEILVFEFPDPTPPGTQINITPKEDGIVLLEVCDQ